MSKDKLNIDTSIWVTQAALAHELGFNNVQRVHNWIKRGQIKSLKIPGSRLVLVDRTSITIDYQKNNRTV